MSRNRFRAVVFDAVGTVIHPTRGAAAMYAEVAAQEGLSCDPQEIRQRFSTAYFAQEAIDESASWTTRETREIARWQAIVAQTLPGTSAAVFEQLYQWFAQPQAWTCPADLAETLEVLHTRGYSLGLASNYDLRLRSVVAGLEPLSRLRDHVVISSEVGWRKPSPQFFAPILASLNLPADEVVYVGDDLANDVRGARAAGMQPLWLDPTGRVCQEAPTLKSIAELIHWLED